MYTNCPDFNPLGLSKMATSVDNPEYIIGQAAPSTSSHLRSRAAPPSAALSDANRVGLPIVAATANGGVPRYMTTQRSSEEESDHEYYNDFDRLQRELQPLKPLRRNETTV
jgi:epidermal growth factor receptor